MAGSWETSCSPCRVGSRRGLALAVRAAAGEPDPGGLEQVLQAMQHASLCGFGQSLPAAVNGLRRIYAEELEPP